MEVRDQEFRNGVLVREVVRTVPDPEPTDAEILDAKLAAITEALAESDDPKVASVAARIEAKGGVPARPLPEAPVPGRISRAVSAVGDFLMAPFRG